jgi:hypothetical protein
MPLESVIMHQPPCGCVWLLAYEETRVIEHGPDGQPRFPDKAAVAERDKLPPQARASFDMDKVPVPPKTHRVVTKGQGETVNADKRRDSQWRLHVTDVPLPETKLCELHAPLGYSAATYAQVLADNASTGDG